MENKTVFYMVFWAGIIEKNYRIGLYGPARLTHYNQGRKVFQYEVSAIVTGKYVFYW